ncbi:MAG TPA: SdpI family protein [Anaerolineales bacterium]|nr:SdpI family protein [Anaerolineales bacterium]
MSTRTTTILVLLMITAATLAGLLLWNRLPDPMASHWNVHDQVDGYTSRFTGVFMLPLITFGMFLLFRVIPAIDPLKANIAQFREMFNLFIVFIVAFMIYLYGLTLAWNLGYTGFRMSGAMLPAIGLLFIFIGVMMRQAKRNFFIGIRTPWTLSSDAVWNETHRLGAVLFIISGALAFFGGFFGGATAFWLLFAPIIGTTLFLLVYSYLLYQREMRVGE